MGLSPFQPTLRMPEKRAAELEFNVLTIPTRGPILSAARSHGCETRQYNTPEEKQFDPPRIQAADMGCGVVVIFLGENGGCNGFFGKRHGKHKQWMIRMDDGMQ